MIFFCFLCINTFFCFFREGITLSPTGMTLIERTRATATLYLVATTVCRRSKTTSETSRAESICADSKMLGALLVLLDNKRKW